MYICIRNYLLKNLDKIIDEEVRFRLCSNAYENCKRSIKREPTRKDFKHFYGINENITNYIMNVLENGYFNDNISYIVVVNNYFHYILLSF